MRVQEMKATVKSCSMRCGVRNVFITLTFLCAIPVRADVSTRTVECVLVDNARILGGRQEKSREFGHANAGHQIGPGGNIVVAIRQFDRPDLPPDSQGFSKTTIALRSFSLDMSVGQSVQVPVLNSFHTEGNSGFVTKGEYDWATNPLRVVAVTRETAGLRLRSSADFSAKNARSGKMKTLRIDVDCPLRTIRVEDLSYWQGREGTNWNAFYPTTLNIQ